LQHRPNSGACGDVLTRCNAELPDKSSRQMALVSEARIHGGVDYAATRGQQPAREIDAPLNQIGVRRRTNFSHERAQHLVAADPGEFCKLGQSYW
jgi:hypothetical protein